MPADPSPVVPSRREISFPPFRLDLVDERLWRGTDEIRLRPKTFAFLRHLVECGGRLVTKQELLDAVWRGIRVGDAVPRAYVRELRELLCDDPEAPRLIETVRGRGYRFLAPTSGADSSAVVAEAWGSGLVGRSTTAVRARRGDGPLVGRAAELEQLRGALERALHGERQIIFVTGEPGIGKTRLVESFFESGVVEESGVSVAAGQSLEHHGAGEPYLPVLEALGRHCRGPGGKRFVAILEQYAPTWLAQMPWLIPREDRDRLYRAAAGASRERMLREIGEAIEAFTAETPVALLLEDLHASDPSTLDLIGFLARRREPARLLLIGTYRSLGALPEAHPLRSVVREMRIHRLCGESSLDFLTEADVGSWLAARFPGSELSPVLATPLHRRTDGNPLFMVSVIDYLIAAGSLVELNGRWRIRGDVESARPGVPEGIRPVIEKQIEGLTVREREVVEVASVAGVEFVTTAIAAGLGQGLEEVEEACLGLARNGQFVRPLGAEAWADGTIGTRYRFVHSIHQEVLYGRLSAARRARLHRAIAARQETGNRAHAEEIAVELALHFERGRDVERALRYLRHAGERAIRRHAPREASTHLRKALELVERLPETVERMREELAIRIALGGQLVVMKGYAAPEVEQTYSEARDLCHRLGQTRHLFPALHGLWLFYATRADLQTARELASQLMALAKRTADRELLLLARWARGCTSLFVGEPRAARADLECAAGLYDPHRHRGHGSVYGQDPGSSSSGFAGMAAWFLGYPDQALAHCETAVSLAASLRYPFATASALGCLALVHQLRGESALTRESARRLVALAKEEDFAFFLSWGRILAGSAFAAEGQLDVGIAEMQDGLASMDEIGIRLFRPYFVGLLAEAWGKAGEPEIGLRMVREALATLGRTGERLAEAELLRVKGELALVVDGVRPLHRAENASRRRTRSRVPDPRRSAERCFRRTIEIARRQRAKSLELRGARSLARLLREEGKEGEARRILSRPYGWFTEGFETRDLLEACELLDGLR